MVALYPSTVCIAAFGLAFTAVVFWGLSEFGKVAQVTWTCAAFTGSVVLLVWRPMQCRLALEGDAVVSAYRHGEALVIPVDDIRSVTLPPGGRGVSGLEIRGSAAAIEGIRLTRQVARVLRELQSRLDERGRPEIFSKDVLMWLYRS